MSDKKTLGASGRFEFIIQLITAAAVLIGIVLVLLELQQSREISTLDMVHSRLHGNVEQNARVFGENLAVTLAKACHNPEELNDAEVMALHMYFHNRMQQMSIAFTGAVIGSFQKGLGLVENWQRLSNSYVNEVLAYPSGQRWVETHPFWGNKDLAKTDEMVAYVQSFNLEPTTPNCSSRRASLTPPQS